MKPADIVKDEPVEETSDIINGVIMNVIDKTQSDLSSEDVQGNVDEASEDPRLRFTIKIYKQFQISLFKPLIPLKLALFFYFGAGSVIQPFLAVYLQQRGLKLTELSTIYIITPIIQLLGPTISGVIADKIGRSKPVLVVNLIITLVFLSSILLVPSMNDTECDEMPVHLRCHRLQFDRLIAEASCGIEKNTFQVISCEVSCPENVTRYCDGQNLICEVLTRSEEFHNFSLAIHVNSSYTSKGECFYNVNSLTHSNSTYSWCDVPHKMYCTISCTLLADEKCSLQKGYRTRLFITTMILMVLFMTCFSNCYRFFDVTSMSLVKEHNKDFGRERIFSILGVLVFSPLAGYIVSATTSEGSPRNYRAAFYLFVAINLVTLAVIWKLKVHIEPPGKRMWKKSLMLMKNPDILMFAFILFVLGTTWAFSKIYLPLYLVQELKAPSYLLGLLPAANSLYGLPFLHSSNWWVNKIGSTNLFVLALVGHLLSNIGYSYIDDAWWSVALEILSIVTYHLLWVAVILHSHSLAPEGLRATVISSAGGLHYGIGKGSGSLIGGLIMDSFGGRTAFRVMAAICTSAAILYSLYLYIRRVYHRKVQRTNDKVQMENEIESNKEESTSVYTLPEDNVKNNPDCR